MGRFARSREKTSRTGQPSHIARFELSNARANRSSIAEQQSYDLNIQRAKGIKLFWIVTASILGLSAGWMLGRAWLAPSQVEMAQVALAQPAAPALTASENEQSLPEENANPSATADAQSQSAAQDQADGISDDKAQPRERAKFRRDNFRAPRAGRRNVTADGPVTRVFKPFKAINPLKLRKMRLW